MLTGRYDGSGEATVTVTGNSSVGPEQFVYDVFLPAEDDADPTVAQLWAQRRVADLLTELRLEGARDSLVAEIVEVATQFGIVTPYTSYLAEEPELAFRDDLAADRLAMDAAAAPVSGQGAVAKSEAVGELAEGRMQLGGESSRVLGDHSYYQLGDVWARDGYEADFDAPEVLVGSDAFKDLIDASPEIAAAAALGERVIVLGPDGWVTIVWPDVEDAG